MVDGIPLVLRDLSPWLRTEHPTLLCRTDLPAGLLDRIVDDAGGVLARDRALLRAYAGAGDDAVRAWVRPRLPPPGAAILDLGCGTGWPDRPDVIGLDLNLALLRRHTGPALVADAADPPFDAGTFDTVLLLGLLDSCRAPHAVLAQATALLGPAGTLLLACAFAWRDEVTPAAHRLTEDDLDRTLAGAGPHPWVCHEVLEQDDLDWVLPVGPRERHVYRVRVWRTRRRDQAASSMGTSPSPGPPAPPAACAQVQERPPGS